MNQCPYCGDTLGIRVPFTADQYYNWDGSPAGYSGGCDERKTGHCLKCGHAIRMMRVFKEGGPDERR